jgi:hypothetical protein
MNASKVSGQARANGIPFDGIAGLNNAIIDVDQVCVGHDWLSSGNNEKGTWRREREEDMHGDEATNGIESSSPRF